MERYIKYKRIEETITKTALQMLFDDLVKEGFEIIYYHENTSDKSDMVESFDVVMVVGKKQSGIL